ncbi:hypothetical protein ACFXPZ_38625 [Streptomyces sp. NPDC059101]|uniref:hypothetical protein n=1 Tax=Streptomyces sp. NPDC059101 TaxID=3346728 RepID=UPI00368B6478
MARKLSTSNDSCLACEGWGPVGYDGRCPRCLIWDRTGAGRHTGVCCRCARTTRLDYTDVCRPCLVEIRYADEEWVRAARAQQPVPRRDLQLTFVFPELPLGRIEPLTKRGAPKLRLLPRAHNWKATHPVAEPPDDPTVCPPQIPGQLALIRLPRVLSVSHGRRIRGRSLAEQDRIDAVARRLQGERGHGPAWRWTLMPLLRLALAAREADEDLVREEDLDQLPSQHGPVTLVLREAGLLRPRSTPKPPATRRCRFGPRRKRRPNASGYRPVPPPPSPPISCTHCLAWTGTARIICEPCRSFGYRADSAPGECERCRRVLPLVAGRCRLCTIAITLGSLPQQVSDQLWLFRDPFYLPRQAAEPVSAAVSGHLVDPRQEALFATPPRHWVVLLDRPLPALTPAAQHLVDALDQQARAEQWNKQTRLANLRVLRIALAHLGGDVPVAEADLRAIAKLRTNFSGLRVAHFLEARGLLEPLPGRDVTMDEAAVTRLAATAPACFRSDVDTWIKVLRGQGRRPSPVKEWTTERRYLGYVLPVLADWATEFTSLREITAGDVKKAVEDRPGSPSRSAHAGLRSMFRALRRERVIFHDPARSVHLGSKTSVPRLVPSDKIAGILDAVPSAFGKLCVALVAIHAVRPLTLRTLLTSDLNRARGRLRTGSRLVYLDDLTLKLIAAWLRDRHRQWPHSTNPHLLVTRRTAMHAEQPPINRFAVLYHFRFTGLTAQQLWSDRILDEARETEDPIHLMRVFGLSATTAVKYVQTAPPERCITDPTQA